MNEETNIPNENLPIVVLPTIYDKQESDIILNKLKKIFKNEKKIIIFNSDIYDETLESINLVAKYETDKVLEELKSISQKTEELPTKLQILNKLGETLNKITKDNIK